MSTCGSTGAQSAFGGTWTCPMGLACGPTATTSRGPSPARAAPHASKTPAQAAWQSSRPESPRGWPSGPAFRPVQPTSGASPVMTVPMLTSTTGRPASRAALTRQSTSSALCAPGSSAAGGGAAPTAEWSLCPAARRAPSRSSRGPTQAKAVPSALYACASSSVRGSWRSSHVVTRLMAAPAKESNLPGGKSKPGFKARPCWAFKRRVAAIPGSKARSS
mmetsp:Transcript_51208/g.163945  ORF Transcript_51208/g.163945 Transcript_51208/m.163945 type:complete len:219 (+) Transcript_51208:600-1256(+)